MAQKIPLNQLLTFVEDAINGGTQFTDHPEFASASWHKPLALILGTAKLKDVVKARADLGIFEMSDLMSFALGFPGQRLGFGLNQINPKTGETVEDPVIGTVRVEGEKKTIEEIEDRDLLLEIARTEGFEGKLRRPKISGEYESPGSPERK